MVKVLLLCMACVMVLCSSGCVRLYHEAAHHEPHCRTSAEFGTWDTYLFFLTIGLPCFLLETLTVVPIVVDQHLLSKHDREHKLGRYKPKPSKRR